MNDNGMNMDNLKELRGNSEYIKALEVAKQLLKENPDDLEVLFEKANIFIALSEEDKAKKLFHKIIDIEQDNLDAVIELSKIYQHENNFDSAVNILENYINVSKNSWQALLQVSRMYRMKGEGAKSIDALIKAQKINPASEEISGFINLVNDVKEPRRGIAPFRVFFTWGMLHGCNYKCTYCYVPQEDKFKLKSPEEVIKAWKRIYDMYGRCRIRLDGGEPSIYPGFIEIISELSKIHKLQINTNLSFDVEKFINNADTSTVRIDASFHPEHTEISKFKEKVIKLNQAGFKVVVAVVAFPPNINKIKQYKSEFENLEIPFIIHPYSGDFDGKIYPDSYSKDEKVIIYGIDEESKTELTWREEHEDERYSERVIDNSESEENPLNENDEKTENEERVCRMGQMYARIYPNGDAFACCTDGGYIGLGNIYDATFKLLDNPLSCEHVGCRCWRCMTPGEEERWLHTWVDDWEIC